MTGEEFGGYIGVDKYCVSKWENGHDAVGEPSDRMVRALSLMLGDGLRESLESAARMFPDIKEAMREVEYRYNAETREVNMLSV